jgi:hypothetical protein
VNYEDPPDGAGEIQVLQFPELFRDAPAPERREDQIALHPVPGVHGVQMGFYPRQGPGEKIDLRQVHLLVDVDGGKKNEQVSVFFLPALEIRIEGKLGQCTQDRVPRPRVHGGVPL